MQNVEHLSGGRVRLAAGTLYGALATLTERGWIVSLGDESEGRKKEYQITPAGREAAVKVEELVSAWEEEAQGGLDEQERRQLGDLLARLELPR